MIVTPHSLVHYLLERGLVTADSAVDGDVVVVDSSSRNRNFKVIRRLSPGYFVKQVKQWDQQSIALLQREASCYWLAGNDAEFRGLVPLVPRYHLYDATRNVLVVELLPGGQNLTDYHRRLNKFPVDVALQLGETLGTYQLLVRAPAAGSPRDATFPRTVPWILSAHQMGDSPMMALSGANRQVMDIIRRYPDFHRLLDALREGWRFDAFIHGDMKWDNCIVYPEDGRTSFKIIDWETADFGDAAWDAGAILQSYLVFWVLSIPITPTTPPAQFLELAPFPIEAMQPAIAAYWRAYLNARRVSGPAARELLLRSVQYGAARMLQTAFEHMYYWPQITGNALCMLQLSLNILSDPASAVTDLFNL